MRTGLKTDLSFSHDRESVMRTGSYIHIYGEPDRFSHGTKIRFSEFSVSFIGFSCSSSSLGTATLLLVLLLFSHYYSSLFITITLLFTAITVLSLLVLLISLLLLLFSHSSYSFCVAVTFLACCCSFGVKPFNY
jgi:hypothetical protein